jgi:hypothetical protein
MAEEWISLRQFAKRRHVSLAAVQKAIKDQRVTAIKRAGDQPDGRIIGIEFHQAMAQWAENTDPEAGLRSGALPASAPVVGELPLQPAGAAAPIEPGKDNKKDYLAARTSREEVSLELDRMRLAKEAGALVSRDDLLQVMGRRYRGMRDQFLSIPDRIADLVAVETDPSRVRTMLQTEIDKVLHELANEAAATAAGGAG